MSLPSIQPDPVDSRLVILYGSQTGNAEEMSKRIGYQAKCVGYNVLVEPMDDFPLPQLGRENFVIFVCSTTGHGQEPENMKNFYNFIRRRDLPVDCLKHLKFAVFGLGDSSYQKFNYVSKILYRRLIHCGAKPLLQLVKGDEKHELGCDETIYPKLEVLWSENRPTGKEKIYKHDAQFHKESSYEILIDNDLNQPKPKCFPFKENYFTNYNIKRATCILNKRITHESHFQDTRHYIFKCSTDIYYEPGDVCAILPENSLENVEQFINMLNLNPGDKISIRKKNSNYMINYLYDFVPDGLTIFDLVKYYLDIQSVPRRSFFEYFCQFSEDELERNKLKEFATTEGQREMYDYCVQPKRSILEVMADFPNTIKNINFSYILDMIPPIKPRSFSIASSIKMHPNQIHLIVGCVKYKTRLKKTRLGLCSTFLSKLVPAELADGLPVDSTGSEIKFIIKKTSFKLPASPIDTPIIMIGPGLGIAPFKSFIEELSMLVQEGGNDSTTRILYFGCRYRDKDFYFEDELKKYESGGLIELKTCFSREDIGPKRVQELMSTDCQLINYLILQRQAVVYVAGNSQLPEELRVLLRTIVSRYEVEDAPEESLDFVRSLELNNRIQYDCW